VVASAAAPEPSKAQRQVWFPGNKAPDYLDGSMPGDFGFDPLSLGSDPTFLRWRGPRPQVESPPSAAQGLGLGCRGFHTSK